MNCTFLIPAILLTGALAGAQNAPADGESRYQLRYSVNAIDDTTFYAGRTEPIPAVLNQVLLEPSIGVREGNRWNFNSSLIGLTATYFDTSTQLRVRETYCHGFRGRC